MIGKVKRARQLWRYLGPKWLVFRVRHAARLRTGRLRRQMPASQWANCGLRDALLDTTLSDADQYYAYRRDRAPRFFFSPDDRPKYQPFFSQWDTAAESPIRIADDLAAGTLHYFEHARMPVGRPPDWRANPFTGQRAPADKHWSEISDFGFGDIKIIWEPSRFGFVYGLVRAYWRTGDERYAELFWQLVEDWRTNNPPQQGPNWKCGQETSFRVMAWCFGLYGFLDASATTAERVILLGQLIAVSGQRIEGNFSYALSQRNNHGISEALGLWTIGVLFPELKSASRWRAKGRAALETQGQQLIYDDGAFSQHSMNYHRVMLHDYLWCLRLGDLHEQQFSSRLRERVRHAGEYLYQLQDQYDGRVPNYGHNDGALVLPLSNCDFQDFRPVIQATLFNGTETRRYRHGPWDEELLWIFGPNAISAPARMLPRTDYQAVHGGYYTLRSPSGFAFVRCARFIDRPGQADMLHVDLWWRGQNVALDPGTFSYNAPDPWNNALASSAYHNVVTVDGQDQMERAGKFLWLPWLSGSMCALGHSNGGLLGYWEGDHDGYHRLQAPVTHRRAIVQLPNETWLVLDRLSSISEHQYRLHWLLTDSPNTWHCETGRIILHMPTGDYHVCMETSGTSAQSSLLRADHSSPRGWSSPYYNSREPALSVDLTVHANSIWFWTLFGPTYARCDLNDDLLRIQTASDEVMLNLSRPEHSPLVTSIALHGMTEDRLEPI